MSQPIGYETVRFEKPVTIWFVCDGERRAIEVSQPMSLLTVAHQNGIDLEGACDGSLACSTCHVIIDSEWYDQLPSPSCEENDMLDLAFNVAKTSRLGCQVWIHPGLDGLTITVPSQTRNLRF